MNNQAPEAVAASYFDALGRGDVPAAMAMFSPDVVWHQPGSNRFSGNHQGIEAIGALLGGMMQASEGTFQLTVTGTPMVNGALVAVPVRFAGKRADTSMDMPGTDLLTVNEGKITEVWLFSSDAASEDAFWGHPEAG
ncbi:nuclear transport factor 2 family protein [Paenarthrobacter sp. CM16]|uniref:nuclear transport factor 2 family protein n=1 Tax=Paenarthrobacter sp. CM16 TaxID=2738447 RepID=UPI00155172BC|nr:nuclear transport factor 2 family protein [Paenarthrobacter sp. CM16]NQD87543.1 nuclear transport factor 2 family protein [Paenarthrobacter sp. CM16]